MSKAEGLSPFGPLTRHREGDVPPTSSTSSSDSPWVGVDAIDDRGDEYIDEVRIEKSRERNREHAKRTRLRKKALIEGMKGRLLELQQEAAKLQQSFEESNMANILLCMSVKADPGHLEEGLGMEGITSQLEGVSGTNIIDQLRNRVRREAAQQVRRARSRSNTLTDGAGAGAVAGVGAGAAAAASSSSSRARSNSLGDSASETEAADDIDSIQPLMKGVVNWKMGTIVGDDGVEQKLSQEELEYLRKERNRIHAKQTRDRKKLFTSHLQQMINALEKQNTMMRNRLKSLAQLGQNLTSFGTVSSALEQASKSTPTSLGCFTADATAGPASGTSVGGGSDCGDGGTSSPCTTTQSPLSSESHLNS